MGMLYVDQYYGDTVYTVTMGILEFIPCIWEIYVQIDTGCIYIFIYSYYGDNGFIPMCMGILHIYRYYRNTGFIPCIWEH